jgi:tetratricopeptide (TPR) repeat protein
LDYSPGNLYSQYVKGYISFAKNRDLQQLKELLLETLKKDTSRLDIIQEIGKVYYYLRDYENAYKYYKKFIDAREALNLNIYNSEDAKIGLVLSEMGQNNQSKKYFEAYKRNAENDQSIYKHLSLAAYYAYYNNQEKAIEHLSLFSKQDNYHYWIVIFIKLDPLFDKIKGLPEFKKINKEIESRFQINHKQIKAALLKEGLI